MTGYRTVAIIYNLPLIRPYFELRWGYSVSFSNTPKNENSGIVMASRIITFEPQESLISCIMVTYSWKWCQNNEMHVSYELTR